VVEREIGLMLSGQKLQCLNPHLCSRDDIGSPPFQWQKEKMRQQSHDEELNINLQQVDIPAD
jgi:hypothetical protein